MIKFLVGLAGCVAVWIGSYGLCDVPTKDSYNFGRIVEGDVVRHEFSLVNSEAYAVVVQQVISECGCLTAVVKGETLQPGQSLVIPVEFDSMGFLGNVKRELEVVTSNQEDPRVKFALVGTVEPLVVFSPASIAFGEISASQGGPPQVLRIKGPVGGQLQLRSLNSFIEISKLPSPTESFEIRLNPPLLTGSLNSAISVGLKGQRWRRLVPVTASVVSNLALSQSALPLGRVREEPVSGTVKLKVFSDVDSINQFETQASDDSLTIDIKPISIKTISVNDSAAKEFSVRVTLNPKKVNRADLGKQRYKPQRYSESVVVRDKLSLDQASLKITALLLP